MVRCSTGKVKSTGQVGRFEGCVPRTEIYSVGSGSPS